jgi:hypothetical protein
MGLAEGVRLLARGFTYVLLVAILFGVVAAALGGIAAMVAIYVVS